MSTANTDNDPDNVPTVEIKYHPFSLSTATTVATSTSYECSNSGNEFQKESRVVPAFAKESEPHVETAVTVKFETASFTTQSVTATDSLASTKKEKKVPKLKKFRPAICALCNMGFPTPSLYEHHMRSVHLEERPYPCRHCKKPFATQWQRRVHERIHDPRRWEGEPKFACDICGKRYHIKYSMSLHRKKIHFGYKEPKRNDNAPLREHHSTCGIKNPNKFRMPERMFPCPQCDLKFDIRSKLQKHIMLSHTKERPFKCSICQQKFLLQAQVKCHIRNVHEKSTPTGMHHPRPKWQAGQPCPCEVCPRVFKMPSQLRRHMLLHTGEKPYKCLSCEACFRLRGDLITHIRRKHRPLTPDPIKLYKCMICGKEKFPVLNDLRRHRLSVHGHLPYESEKEKPFGCVVCGKPCMLREDAIICAFLGHDPSSLLHDMFRFKCPECPPETFGFHNLSVFRRHWQEEHSYKFLPVHFRKGMNDPIKIDELPKCRMSKAVVQNWKQCGIPPELFGDGPLFTEFPLLPIPEENRFKKKGPWKRRKEKKPKEKKRVECEICGLSFSTNWNLKKHVQRLHNPSRMRIMPNEKSLLSSASHSLKPPLKPYKCCHCEQSFRKMKTLRLHERKHLKNPDNITRGRGRPRKIVLKTNEKSNTCADFDSIISIKEEPIVSPDNNLSTWFSNPTFLSSSISNSGSNSFATTANVKDVTAVAKVLNGKELRIVLTRCNHQIFTRGDVFQNKTSLSEDKIAENKWSSVLGNKIIKIILEKVDK